MHDPVFDTPTQYGGAYYAWCCAVLAAELGGSAAEEHRARAERSLAAAVAHTADPDREPYASGFDRPHAQCHRTAEPPRLHLAADSQDLPGPGTTRGGG